MKQLLLASESPRRIALLRTCGIDYVVFPANIQERPLAGEFPIDTALRLAREKAEAVKCRAEWSKYFILAADTLVVDGETILGKPADRKQAGEFLKSLRGRTHRVITGVCLLSPGQPDAQLDFVETSVCMRDYSYAEVTAYLDSGDAMDKAGAYAIQHPLFRPVSAFSGCYANIVGLPVCRVRQMLETAGWEGLPSLPDGCREQSECGFQNEQL
jgi:MAF protein